MLYTQIARFADWLERSEEKCDLFFGDYEKIPFNKPLILADPWKFRLNGDWKILPTGKQIEIRACRYDVDRFEFVVDGFFYTLPPSDVSWPIMILGQDFS